MLHLYLFNYRRNYFRLLLGGEKRCELSDFVYLEGSKSLLDTMHVDVLVLELFGLFLGDSCNARLFHSLLYPMNVIELLDLVAHLLVELLRKGRGRLHVQGEEILRLLHQ